MLRRLSRDVDLTSHETAPRHLVHRSPSVTNNKHHPTLGRCKSLLLPAGTWSSLWPCRHAYCRSREHLLPSLHHSAAANDARERTRSQRRPHHLPSVAPRFATLYALTAIGSLPDYLSTFPVL
nr:hypothetical protein CFP56_52299 [Quercus suber]